MYVSENRQKTVNLRYVLWGAVMVNNGSDVPARDCSGGWSEGDGCGDGERASSWSENNFGRQSFKETSDTGSRGANSGNGSGGTVGDRIARMARSYFKLLTQLSLVGVATHQVMNF